MIGCFLLAGHELLLGNVKVIDIALKYGYETPEGFSKAFARFHGITPNEVKKRGAILKSFNRPILKIILEGGNSMDYRIEKRDVFQVVAKTRYFNEETSKTEVPRFWGEYFQSKLHEKVYGMIGICGQAKDNTKEWKYGIGSEMQYVSEIWIPVKEK